MYDNRNNLIIGFHGCDERTTKNLINNPQKLYKSEKPTDWLGNGFYFRENNYERALEWAKDKQRRGVIKKASVVGALLSLDYCLDFTDSKFINSIIAYYDLLKVQYEALGEILPTNKNAINDKNKDLLIRELDCTVIEFMHQKISSQIENDNKEKGFSEFRNFDSARGLFTEGGAAFPGAGIQKKNHIQICIRNMNCIKGFFLPRKSITLL